MRSFTRGQLLIEEGDASDALYILVAGRLKVFTRDDKGRELVYKMVNHVIRDLVQGGFLSRDQDRQLVVLKKLPRKW